MSVFFIAVPLILIVKSKEFIVILSKQKKKENISFTMPKLMALGGL